jgi:hypothetical protein
MVDQFDQMEASLLLCPTCRRATPVRKRLLLVLAEGEKFDYVCTVCGNVAGDKLERPPDQRATSHARQHAPPPPLLPRRR